MKKYFYIICLALFAAACVDPLEKSVAPFANDAEDGPKVAIEFSLPPVTKGSMAHDPTIDSIHVAVFNQNGVLKQYEKAVLTNKNNLQNGDNTADGNPVYTVNINMSTQPRILHFIADSPVGTYDQLVALAGTSGEDVIMNALTTSGGETAYWQRFELEKIDAYKYNGISYSGVGEGAINLSGEHPTYNDPNFGTITVNEGDYIKRNGTKVIDGTGYFQSDYVKGILNNIPFVRNFAEITVFSVYPTKSNFEPKQFALVNVPTSGYVAAYDVSKGAFSEKYTNIPSGGLTHEHVAGTTQDPGYPGSLAGGFDTGLPTTFIDLTSANTKAYMYERTIPNDQQPATCILVGGIYHDPNAAGGTGLTWFKIEITDPLGQYFPIYRGISYAFEIGNITGTKGYATPKAAFEHDAIGDVSGSVETATLEQISDGQGTTLWVEYIDYVSTGGTEGGESTTIYYTMFYQNGSTIEYLPVSLSVNHPNNDEAYKAIGSFSDNNTYSTRTGSPDDSKKWRVATVNLNAPGQNARQSFLHIEGTSHANKAMYRDVDYHVIGTLYFKNGQNEVNATSLATEALGEETTVTIYLPNDLGYAMFPLDIRIEAQNGDFTTVDGLPVESGPSLFDESKNAYYFIKTVEYSDYYNAETGVTTTRFTTKLKTTREGSSSEDGTNATKIRVRDKVQTERGRTEPYFAYAECDVTVGGAVFMLDKESVNVDINTVSATFHITSTGNENPQWKLRADDRSVSFLPDSTGTGSQDITVRFLPNTALTAKTYTITALREGFENQIFTIVQNGPEFSISPASKTVFANDESATFTLTSTGSTNWNWELTASSNLPANALSQTSGSGSAEITVSFPKNTSITDAITYTVTAKRTGFDDQTFTIVQMPKQKVEGRTVSYTFSDFGPYDDHEGGATYTYLNPRQTRNSTKGNINVSISGIYIVTNGFSSTYGGMIEITSGETSTVIISPVNDDSVSGVTITDVSISFLRYNGKNYNPDVISGPFTGGTGTANTTSALTATYSGSASQNAISVNLTDNPGGNSGFDIVYIEVTYDYYE